MRTDDITLIAGKKRSGKSYFVAKSLIPLFLKSKRHVLVWDYNWEHLNGAVTHNLKDIVPLLQNNLLVVYQPISKTPFDFSLFCSEVLKLTHVTVVFEEVEHFADHNIVYNQPEFKRLIDSGRHQDIGLVCTSRRVMWLASDIPANLDNFFIFRQTRPQDLKYLSEWVGEDVYKVTSLPEFGYLFYDDRLGTLAVMAPIKVK